MSDSHSYSSHLSQLQVRSSQAALFTPLCNLVHSNIVNVVAVIIHMKEPTKSRGEDYCCSLSLTDPTLSPDKIFIVNLFRNNPSSLPQKCQPGDIIRLHNIKIQLYQGKLMGSSLRSTIWEVYSNVYPSLPQKWLVEDLNLALFDVSTTTLFHHNVVSLLARYWGNGQKETCALPQVEISKLNQSYHNTTLCKDIQPEQYFMMIGEVREIALFGDNRVIVTLTDYTPNSQLHLTREAESETESQETSFNRFLASKNMLLRCTLWDEHAHYLSNQSIDVGQFIAIRNLHSISTENTIIASLHGEKAKITSASNLTSKHITFLKEKDERVAELLQRSEKIRQDFEEYNKQYLGMAGHVPLTTRICHSVHPVSKIENIINASEIGNYRCQGKVVDMIPKCPNKFRRRCCIHCLQSWECDVTLLGRCPIKEDHRHEIKHVWIFSLLVMSSDDEVIPIVFFGDDAKNFLSGVLPPDFLEYENFNEDIKVKLGKWKLLEKLKAKSRLHDFCIMSYEVIGDNGALAFRYRGFGTKLDLES